MSHELVAVTTLKEEDRYSHAHHPCRNPSREAARGPGGKRRIRVVAIVLIHTDQGLQGIGRGGDPQVIARDLAPLLIGRDPLSIAQLWEQMYEAVWRGPGQSAMSSIGALDVALWDLCGKICGQPVWRLLGGYRDKIPVYADGAGYQNAPDQSPQGIATQVKKFVDLGYDAVKIHMYRAANPAEVVERVQRSRELIGPRKKLMIDVHHAWERRRGRGDRPSTRSLPTLLD